ncbi:MAG: glycosyltransferase family 4 protein [Thermoguttaceae bacterium]|jgi:glycosyltransferase involved in cell wall biosynthesis
MKILIAINQARVLYDFKRELVDALLARGDEVLLSFEEDFRAEYFRKTSARIIPTPIDPRGVNPFRDLKLRRFYRELLQREKPDVVLLFTIKPNVYCGAICGKLGVPYCATISGLGAAMNGSGPLRWISTCLYRRGLRRADRVVCQNAAIVERVVSERIARREQIVQVAGSGVDLSRFEPLPYPDEESKITLLFIGRLMRDKGVAEFLECARRIRAKRHDVAFQMIGASERGCREDVAVSTAAEEGSVEYLGYQKDVKPYLKEASALILPSYHEGLSNVLLEAAAAARPVLASDVPGCREVFDEGVTGFGFKPRSADAVVDAVEKFLALPRQERRQMGQKGREKVAVGFSRADVVATYLREIDAIRRR